jgi:hypothetical protein
MKFFNYSRYWDKSELGYNIETRVPDWITVNQDKLLDLINQTVENYLKANTDPVIYDKAQNNQAQLYICEKITAHITVPEVPLVKELASEFKLSITPLAWLDDRGKTAVKLYKRLNDLNSQYVQSTQYVKKKIYNALFTDNSSELDKLLEEELII